MTGKLLQTNRVDLYLPFFYGIMKTHLINGGLKMTLYNSQLKDMALALSSEELEKINNYHTPIQKLESVCPKCKEELDFDEGLTMELEYYYCAKCDIRYEVQCEMIRFWETLEEVEK